MPGNLAHLQNNNLRSILDFLRENGGITRQDLVEKTGLSASGVSKLVSFLLQKDLVVEDTVVSRNKGRRAISLRLNEDALYAIGVRLARNYIKCGLFNAGGHMLWSAAHDISSKALSETKALLTELINTTLHEANKIGARVSGIGISAPGPLFTYEGRIVLTSNHPEWKDFSIKDFVMSQFDIPVYVEHDANVSVLAEKWFGKGVGSENLIYVVVDRGVGAGIYNNGSLYRGHRNIAGEIGHITIDYNGPKCECGNRGCLEMFCSSFAVLKEANEVIARGKPEKWPQVITTDILFSLARSGDFTARSLVEKAGTFLGIGLANLINVYNPERIILGDEMTRAGDYWFDAVKAAVKERTLPEIYAATDIQLSTLAIEPAFLGTGSLVIAEAFEKVSGIGMF